MRDSLGKLGRKVEDLEDVKFLMDVLQKVRNSVHQLELQPRRIVARIASSADNLEPLPANQLLLPLGSGAGS